VSARTYLSIGDVLSLLRQEFPDVTISKIRFLESQGLVNPERTPSGYRKFYEHDVERLRWVLRQQREHFLPLKVIKGRLEQEGDDAGAAAPAPAEALSTSAPAASRDPERAHAVPALVGSGGAGDQGEERNGLTLPGFEAHQSAPAATTAVAGAAATRPAEPAPAAAGAGTGATDGTASARAGTGGVSASARRAERPQGTKAAAATAPEPAPSSGRAAASRSGSPAPAAVVDSGAHAPVVALSGTSMTLEELAAASGLGVEATAELESFGLLAGKVVGGVAYYDEDALTVARLAAGFAEFGVEARHLRLHKHAAEREAGFIEQIVLPLLRQRNPESRQRAQETTAELSRLGQALRAVLLRAALRNVLGG
jgi:DNA-binding transcriptional MerR regulator